MKVLITGGAGFIGSNLVDELARNPAVDEVRVIDDLSTSPRPESDWLADHFIEASILDDDALSEAADGVDAIVHLAALGSVPRSVENPVASHEANATGTLKVLQAAQLRGAHVVLASSSSVYGANPILPKSEDLQCLPMSPYAVTKLATEQYAMAFAACYGLDVLPFRFFNVYGPGQRAGHVYAAVVPVFLDAVINGRPLPINGDGEQSRDFTYVGTVTEVIATAVIERVTAGPTNLAFGTRTSLLELISVIKATVDGEVRVTHKPDRPGDVKHSQANNDRLRELFPSVVPVDLQDGVRAAYRWMLEAQ